MICPNCGQETESGKFCTNCGSPLQVETPTTAKPNPTVDTGDTAPVTAWDHDEHEQPLQPDAESQTSEQASTQEHAQDPVKPNEFVETLKRESANFGHFFWDMLKGPDKAKKINHTSMTPAIITMVIFSVLIALGSYLIANQVGVIWGGVSFLDSFLIPLFQFIILFAVLIVLVFGGAKIAAQTLSLTDVVAKIGAYTVPFLVLTIAGSILTLIGLTVASVLVILGLLGPIIIVPTLILLEQPTNGFDRIYVLLGIYIVALLISGMLVKSILDIFLGGMMDSLIGF